MLLTVGFFRIPPAIIYFANSVRVIDLTNGAFQGHIWASGVWDLCVAAFALSPACLSWAAAGSGGWSPIFLGDPRDRAELPDDGQTPWYAAPMILLAVMVLVGL